jgi:hypothetical protein
MAEIGKRNASMRLQCQACGWPPPEDATMEAVLLHFQVDHDTDEVKMDLVGVCSCGAAMDVTDTRPTGGGFKDYMKCGACGNTGHVVRSE